MSWFKRRPKPEPEPISVDFPLIQDWEIVTQMGDGVVATLQGHVSGDPTGEDAMEWVRYVRAIGNGLRAEGFDAEVSISHRVQQKLTP